MTAHAIHDRIEAWLDAGPQLAPDGLRISITREIAATPQVRRHRLLTPSVLVPLAAALALVAVLIGQLTGTPTGNDTRPTDESSRILQTWPNQPEWFVDREPLPFCGESSTEASPIPPAAASMNVPGRHCLLEAFRSNGQGEFVSVVEIPDQGPFMTVTRVLGTGRIEVISDLSRQSDGGWVALDCTDMDDSRVVMERQGQPVDDTWADLEVFRVDPTSCSEREETREPLAPSGSEERWITVDVANATDTASTLAVVDENDLTRVVGMARPSTVAAQTTEQVRLLVPEDVRWVVTSNGVGGLYAEMVDGWCGDLPVTINLAEGIVEAAVPAYVHSGPGNCLGPVPPVRLALYMRDQSVLGIGWKLVSGGEIEEQGLVSEEPTAVCVVVPYDWELHLWTEEDIMERPDRFAGTGPSLTAGDVVPDPDLAITIDIPVIPNAEVRTGVPDWWDGPKPDCPELPDASPAP
ncbi:MAG: hypothetical protein M3Y40_00235 [Chloroflexota bacterium]|nr:hypothetical protein [Chloroflexota bacterium]